MITGTSNEFGYTVTAVSPFFVPNSNTTEAQFYNDLPNSYDDLHLGADFTIVLDQPIDYLLVALANDNDTGDGPDFGLTPVDSIGVNISETQIEITDIGGALVLYSFDSPTDTVSHTNLNILDGFDVSFLRVLYPPLYQYQQQPGYLDRLFFALQGWLEENSSSVKGQHVVAD